MPTRLTRPRWTHVALPVTDLDRSVTFYTSVCPLVVVARNADEGGRSAWLSNDGQVEDPFVLVLAEFPPEIATRFGQHPGEKATTLAPFAHLGIELPRREDVDAAADRARAVGALRWEPRHISPQVGYVCAVEDPDGNLVEFSHDQKVFQAVKELWSTAGPNGESRGDGAGGAGGAGDGGDDPGGESREGAGDRPGNVSR